MPRLRRVDCSEPGIRRARRGRGFSYLGADGAPIRDREVLERIGALAIPPAWEDVWICPDERGHIQATGVDAAGRKQYRYHDAWRERQDRVKFDRMLDFARALPRLRTRLDDDLTRRGLARERVLACGVCLLDLGFFRVGSERYAAENETYGLATLRRGHLRFEHGEAVFDYRNPTCGGAYPSISTFPRTLGATLLATGATSDFTLVRLAQSPPPGSFFLGWSTEDYSRRGGTAIYRLSYPAPAVGIWPQYYSRHTISAVPTPGSCSGAPQGHFIYSKDSYGGTAEGSSGSPVLLADGRIVGQLLGSCGSNTGDDCDATSNSTIDGAFAVSYPQLERWLNASGTSTPPASTCVPNATTLCLNGNRFQAQVSWRVASQGTAGNGTAISLSGDTGYFWFFSSGNVELVVKALDGRAVNGYFWIFYGALSDVEYTLTVTDTATGAVKTYSNPQGRLASTADTSAFR